MKPKISLRYRTRDGYGVRVHLTRRDLKDLLYLVNTALDFGVEYDDKDLPRYEGLADTILAVIQDTRKGQPDASEPDQSTLPGPRGTRQGADDTEPGDDPSA